MGGAPSKDKASHSCSDSQGLPILPQEAFRFHTSEALDKVILGLVSLFFLKPTVMSVVGCTLFFPHHLFSRSHSVLPLGLLGHAEPLAMAYRESHETRVHGGQHLKLGGQQHQNPMWVLVQVLICLVLIQLLSSDLHIENAEYLPTCTWANGISWRICLPHSDTLLAYHLVSPHPQRE